ncbi:MAG TPA: hypothetical protein VEK57_05210 [Thermoanaerobaculia bacterium]|nr:hypothetical protein [Thermoanaerobaculia bacterium]
MRRFATGVFAVYLLCSTALFARDVELREARQRDRTAIERLVRHVIKYFRPANTGDSLSPPKP